MSNKNSKGNKSSNQNNSKKSGNKSNRDDFDSGKKVSASKPHKPTRKEKNRAKFAEEHPELVGVKVNYAPTNPVAAIEKVLTGTPAEMAKVILEGSHLGLVRLHDDGYDVTFRVTTEEMHGMDFIVVYIHEAKSGVLAGLSGNKTFVTKGQLHAGYFKSNLAAGTTNYGVQMKMFHFLQSIFYQVGLLSVAEPKKVSEQKVTPASAVKQAPAKKANPFASSQQAYAIAEKKAIPDFMNAKHGTFNLFGLILHIGPHPKSDRASIITLVRTGAELGNTETHFYVPFKTFLFGNPETDVLSGPNKKEATRLLAFLRRKLSVEIAGKTSEEEKEVAWKKAEASKSTETTSVQLGIAVASQFQTLHLSGDEPEIYSRCHGPNSTHQKV